MNRQNNSVQTAPPTSNLDQLCIQRLQADDFASKPTLSIQIKNYLRSFKRG